MKSTFAQIIRLVLSGSLALLARLLPGRCGEAGLSRDSTPCGLLEAFLSDPHNEDARRRVRQAGSTFWEHCQECPQCELRFDNIFEGLDEYDSDMSVLGPIFEFLAEPEEKAAEETRALEFEKWEREVRQELLDIDAAMEASVRPRVPAPLWDRLRGELGSRIYLLYLAGEVLAKRLRRIQHLEGGEAFLLTHAGLTYSAGRELVAEDGHHGSKVWRDIAGNRRDGIVPRETLAGEIALAVNNYGLRRIEGREEGGEFTQAQAEHLLDLLEETLGAFGRFMVAVDAEIGPEGWLVLKSLPDIVTCQRGDLKGYWRGQE